MTHEELLAWRERMGWTQASAAEALGVAVKSYQELERGAYFGSNRPLGIDRRTALACTALAFGLPEWPTQRRVAHRVR